VPSYAANFNDLVGAVSDKLRLDSEDDYARAGLWVNGAIAKIAIETGFFRGEADAAVLTKGQSTAILPTSLVRLDYITADDGGQKKTLAEAVSLDLILSLRAQGVSSGPPRIYYLWQGTVEFWPDANGGESMHFFGSLLPEILSGFDLCPLPEPFSKLVEYLALIDGAQFKKDPLLDEYRAFAQEWNARFWAYVNQRKGRKGLQFDVRTFEENRYIPHDPSTDLLTWP